MAHDLVFVFTMPDGPTVEQLMEPYSEYADPDPDVRSRLDITDLCPVAFDYYTVGGRWGDLFGGEPTVPARWLLDNAFAPVQSTGAPRRFTEPAIYVRTDGTWAARKIYNPDADQSELRSLAADDPGRPGSYRRYIEATWPTTPNYVEDFWAYVRSLGPDASVTIVDRHT